MSLPLKPYPAYQDSGVPWLGPVPEHWEVRRLGESVIDSVNGTWGNDPDGKNDVVCVRVADFDRIRRRVRIDRPTLRSVDSKELWRRQLRKGDLLLEKSGGGDNQPVGVVMMYDHDTPAVCSNFIARMRVARGFQSAYLVYLHACLYSLGINIRSVKQTTGIQNLDSRSYLSEPVGYPPLPEQAAIARFLDHTDRRIRRYIRAKQRLIKLLEEHKQAIIHQAVTRGLDPNVRLKPSGVEWLGDMPEHWDILPLRRVTLSRCDGPFGSGLKSTHYTADGVRVIRLQNIGCAEFKDTNASYISPDHFATLGDHSVLTGDLLIAGLGDSHIPAGRACIAPAFIEPAMVKADCFRFRLDLSLISAQFAALQLTATAISATAALTTGATRQRINLQATASRLVALPPLSEQKAITEELRFSTESLKKAMQKLEHEISLMQEYRTRLIADVVTGKLDVREAAAGLLDESFEPEEPELLEEAGELADEELGVEDAEEDAQKEVLV